METKTLTNYDYKSDTFINLDTAKKPPSMGFFETIGIAKKIFCDKASRAPKGRIPEVKPNMAEFLKPSSNVKFMWFGHSTLLLNLDGKILLIDPVFSDYAFSIDMFVKRFQSPVLTPAELPHIDAVVISHDHYDHLDQKTIEFFKDKSTGFIVPIGVGDNLRDWGISPSRIVELNWGGTVTHNGLTFTAAPAQHFSGRGLFDRNKTLWASWVIQGREERIFYSGDTGYGDHFKEIGKRYGPFDVTFIENGQYNEKWPDVHMQPEESIQAHLDLNGKLFVPVHWGMFDLSLHKWNEPVERSYKIATAWDIPIYVPKLGEIVDTANNLTQQPWWHEQEQEAAESLTFKPKPALSL